jgi:hypothetical protein
MVDPVGEESKREPPAQPGEHVKKRHRVCAPTDGHKDGASAWRQRMFAQRGAYQRDQRRGMGTGHGFSKA